VVKSAKKLRKELMKFSATARARMETEAGLTMLGTTGHTELSGDIIFKKSPSASLLRVRVRDRCGPSISRRLNGEDPVNPRQWRQAYVHGKFADVPSGSFATNRSKPHDSCMSASPPKADNLAGASLGSALCQKRTHAEHAIMLRCSIISSGTCQTIENGESPNSPRK
jgi:hypothetical protein